MKVWRCGGIKQKVTAFNSLASVSSCITMAATTTAGRFIPGNVLVRPLAAMTKQSQVLPWTIHAAKKPNNTHVRLLRSK